MSHFIQPTIILLDTFRDGLNLSLLTVGASELEAPHLKGDQTVALLHDVH